MYKRLGFSIVKNVYHTKMIITRWAVGPTLGNTNKAINQRTKAFTDTSVLKELAVLSIEPP